MSNDKIRTKLLHTYKWESISPYFTKEEIFSPDTIRHPHLINVDAIIKLNLARRIANVPLLVNHGGHNRRGVRSPKDQMELLGEVAGAAEMSMHVQGRAFDVSSKEATLEEVREALLKAGFTFTLMYDTFVHADDRDIVE